MAKIVHSELAPEGAVHYSLGNEEFDLGDGYDSFETEDRAVISNANAHPWLDVEVDAEKQLGGDYAQGSLSPEEDALSSVNSVAFDADAIREVEESKRSEVSEPTAIDAGLDQGEEHSVDGVATTLAADHADETDDNPEEINF